MVTARTVNTPCQGADNVRVAGYLMTGPWAQLGKQVCRYQVPRPTAPDALHDDQMMSRTETLSSPLTPICTGSVPQCRGAPGGYPPRQNATAGAGLTGTGAGRRRPWGTRGHSAR